MYQPKVIAQNENYSILQYYKDLWIKFPSGVEFPLSMSTDAYGERYSYSYDEEGEKEYFYLNNQES